MALRKTDLLAYTEKAVAILVERGTFANRDTFRTTQRDALTAYLKHLRDPLLPVSERLGFTFELSMALGKTAIYLGIFEEIYKLASADGKKITGGVVVPLVSIFDNLEGEIEKYAPSIAARTNYYGAGSKETEGDFGVYIYQTFIDLVNAGSIKLDVLFSDEAHRGTSANRTETYISQFLGKILSIGLTATGAFDREKTIQKTHGRHGFKRSSADSIRLGELADYAQAQLHVIRVAPQPNEPPFENEQERSRYYAALAKKAWTATTRTILESGRDEHTGDPLSDNISAFYCSDIAHIIDTADALNASSILNKKARALGFSGVAVAVHSKMRRAERKAAMRGFDEGRYMAVVSDGVIKEGYNNSRIKNIFDYPRGSIVEKAQIIGRALRRLWNTVKARWEGATIIDTVVYHGHDDIIKDQVAREASIVGVVTAWQVLSDTVVYGPGAEQSAKSKSSEPLPPLAIDAASVESFVSIESINIIRAGLKKEKEERIQLNQRDPQSGKTPRERLQFEYARSGLSVVNAMTRIIAWAEANNLQAPQTLDAVSLRNWLSGSVSALKADFDFAMEALASTRETWIQFNDVDPKTGNSYEQDFQAQFVKMGRSIKGMLDHIHRWAAQRERRVPTEIDYNLLKTFSQQPRSARKDLYDFVMTSLADAQPIAVKTLIKLDEIDPVSGITPRAAFLNHYTRSGRSAKLILAHAAQWAKDNGRDVPKGLSERMIAKWPKFVSSANAEMFNFVMDALPSVPSVAPSKIVRIELDAKDPVTGRTPRELFLAEYERMGRSIKRIYEHLTQWSTEKGIPIPEDLTVAAMKTWVQVAQTASLDAVELTMEALQSARSATVAAIPFVQLDAVDETTGITPRQSFIVAYEKNGRSITAIFDQIEERKANGDEIPPGLTPNMISTWVERAQSARQDLFDLVLDILKGGETFRPATTKIERKAKAVRARSSRNALD